MWDKFITPTEVVINRYSRDKSVKTRRRRFRLFSVHLDEYLSENDVKSRFSFGRDSPNYLTDLLSDDLARNTAFQYALPSPWALTSRPKILGEFPEISIGKWYSLIPLWKSIIIRLEFLSDL